MTYITLPVPWKHDIQISRKFWKKCFQGTCNSLENNMKMKFHYTVSNDKEYNKVNIYLYANSYVQYSLLDEISKFNEVKI